MSGIWTGVALIAATAIVCGESRGRGDRESDGGRDSALVYLDKTLVRARRARPSSSTTVIEAGELSARYSDLPGMLERAAGLMIRRMGGYGEYADVSIRGADARNARILLDGVPLNSAAGGAVDLGKLPVSALHRIEVYKGAAPLSLIDHGGGAVINIATAPGTSFARLSLEGGSYGFFKGGAAARIHAGAINHRASIDYANADNRYRYYHDNNTSLDSSDDRIAVKENAHVRQFSAMYAQSAELSPALLLRASCSYAQSDKGIHIKEYAGEPQEASVMNRTAAGRLGLRWECTPRLAATLRVTGRYARDRFEDPLGQVNVVGDSARKLLLTSDPALRARLLIEAGLPAGLSAAASAGAAGERFTFDNALYEADDGGMAASRVSAFAAFQTAFESRRLHASIRYNHGYARERSTFTDHPFQSGDTQPPAHSHHPGGAARLRVRISDALAFDYDARYDSHPVSFADRYGFSRGAIGNPRLRAQRRLEHSLGLSCHGCRLHMTAAVFHAVIRDFIAPVVQSRYLIMSENIGDIRQAGFEWDAHLWLGAHVRLDNAFHVIDSRIIDHANARRIGQTPVYHSPLRETLGLTLAFGPIRAGHALTLHAPMAANIQNTASFSIPPSLTAYISAHFLDHGSLTYRIDNYTHDAYEREFLPNQPLPGRTHHLIGSIHF